MYQKNQQKMLNRLISHPRTALPIVRNLIARRRKACVRCGSLGVLHVHHTDHRGIRIYQCRACQKTFSELTGTIFHKSKVPLALWLRAILEWVLSTGGISAAELGRRLGISHITAWKMLMKVRATLEADDAFLSGALECDESWCGKKKNQDIIFGIVQRQARKLKFSAIPNTTEVTLRNCIYGMALRGSTINTDGHTGYGFLSVFFHHQTVNHSQQEWARDDAHTNTIEQIWGWFKGIVRTIHHGISKKYRMFYLQQFAFRYEHEHSSDLFYATLVKIFSPTYCLI